MAIHNCAEIGENLIKIVSRLMANDDLVNLLYYNDQDPLSQPHLTQEQKQKFVFEKLIKTIPRVGPKETANSIVVIRVVRGDTVNGNNEFKDIQINIEVFVPLTQWFVKSTNLRPFMILGEIQKSLNDKKVNGLGKMSGGDFALNFMTEEAVSYEQVFRVTTYD